MKEPTLDAIEASLRQQFEPPPLDALTDRITALAAQMEPSADEADQPELQVVESAAEPRRNEGDGQSSRLFRRRVGFGVAATVAAAAAVVLLLAQRNASERLPAVPTEQSPTKVASATPSRVAGGQLDTFLRSGAYTSAPAPDADCMADQPPLASEDLDLGAPTLSPSLAHRVLWECGGWTGVDCAAHDLPAQRLMVVELVPSGQPVIVCIEPPWADPRPQLPEDSDFKIFRRTLSNYVLYEVTTSDEPSAIQHVTI